METSKIPFRLRPNPLAAGQNIMKMDARLAGAVTKYAQFNHRKFADFERTGFIAQGEDCRNAFAHNLDYYAYAFGVNPVSILEFTAKIGLEPPIALDVGCGFAVAARQIAQRIRGKADVFGMDVHAYDQKQIMPGLPLVPVFTGIMESFPFIETNLFHLIMLHQSLTYSLLPYATLDHAIEFLKPSGTVLLNLSIHADDNEQRGFHQPLADLLVELSVKRFSNYPRVSLLREKTIGDVTNLGFGIQKPEGKMRKDFFSELALKRNLPIFHVSHFATK